MKILVTGANGQLGMSLRRLAAQEGKAHSWIFTDVVDGPDTVRLDITDRSAVRELIARENVEALVNCAAYTNVEAAEEHEDLAELLNATAVGILADAMKDSGGLLVHISTDYVFGKEPYNTPCREDRKGTPTGVYGLTKLHGEEAILRSGVRHVILRTAWLYSEFGKNFVKTMLKLTAEKPVLQVVFDQAGTPTYAGDLAGAILRVLENPVPGIYHYSNEGVCSWYDSTRMIAAFAGHTACDIRPCHSDEFPSKVHRPAYSVLDKTKIKETYGLSIPYWTDSLRLCIGHLLQEA
jgi:dTDP-4-dehydrorhamnose reductase